MTLDFCNTLLEFKVCILIKKPSEEMFDQDMWVEGVE
jgi:hypothetical protein